MSGWCARFGLWIAAVQVLAMARYLAHAGPAEDGLALLYRALAIAGQAAWWAGLPMLGLAVVARWLPRGLVIGLGVLVATLTTSMLLADTLVYDRWRFHLDFTLLALFFGPGGDRIFALGPWSRAALWGLPALVAAWTALGAHLARRPWPRVGLAWTLLGLSFAGHHALHAWADATYATSITRLTRHLPLFAPLTARPPGAGSTRRPTVTGDSTPPRSPRCATGRTLGPAPSRSRPWTCCWW